MVETEVEQIENSTSLENSFDEIYYRWYRSLSLDGDDASEDKSLGIFPIANMKPFEPQYKLVKNALVTYFADDHGLLDHHIFFSLRDFTETNNERPSEGARVDVTAEQVRENGAWVATSVVLHQLKKEVWDESDAFHVPTVYEEQGYLIDMISSYESETKLWTMNQGFTFGVEDIIDKLYVPEVNDWVRSKVVEKGKIRELEPLRKQTFTGTVVRSEQDDNHGVISGDVYFTTSACNGAFVGFRDLVEVTAVECKYKYFSWRAIKITVLQHVRKSSGVEKKKSSESLWPLRGEKPVITNTRSKIPSFLPQYGVPASLRERVKSGGDIFAVQPDLKYQLNRKNYVNRFAALLYLEEIAVEIETDLYEVQNVVLTPTRDDFIRIKVAGLERGRPTIMIGDIIKLSGPSVVGQDHRGFVHDVLLDEEAILVKFHQQLVDHLRKTDRFVINFSYSRLPFRRCHLALRQAHRLMNNVIFPNHKRVRLPGHLADAAGDAGFVSAEASLTDAELFDKRLNCRQRLAVSRMLGLKSDRFPYILFGPPGTGKTVTLTELILQLLRRESNCRLLVCAPSNSAVDTLCTKLHESGEIDVRDVTRFNAFRRPTQLLHECVSIYSRCQEDLGMTVRSV